MDKMTTEKVAIVGGGPGGLTLARLLQRNGVKVRVYERDISPAARVQGATLNLNEESGLEAIRKAGLMDAFRAAYRPGAEKLIIADQDANVLLNDLGGDSLQEERPEIDRGPLRKLLLDSLLPDTVVWNSQFVSLNHSGGPCTIGFQNGASERADIVVAADGANSKLRPYLTPIKPFYSGVTVVEGSVYDAALAVPRLHEMLDGGKICVLGEEKSLFIVAKGDGSIAFYTGHKTEEGWARASGIDFANNQQVMGWIAQDFGGWNELWRELFQQATDFVPRPQYCAPLDQAWEALPNLTMIGDAAHVMPPYAGEGVNMAMLDALELTECLLSADYSDTRSAIAAYETQMRCRTAAVAEETLRFTDIFHSPNAIGQMVDFFKSHLQ